MPTEHNQNLVDVHMDKKWCRQRDAIFFLSGFNFIWEIVLYTCLMQGNCPSHNRRLQQHPWKIFVNANLKLYMSVCKWWS